MINDCMLFASFCSSKKTIGCDGINILFLYCVYTCFVTHSLTQQFYVGFILFWLHWVFLPRVLYLLFIAYAFSFLSCVFL